MQLKDLLFLGKIHINDGKRTKMKKNEGKMKDLIHFDTD